MSFNVATASQGFPAFPHPDGGSPYITGASYTQGQNIVAHAGVWSGYGSMSYAYQWFDEVTGSMGATGNANTATLTLQAGNAGHRVRCRVTATSNAGVGGGVTAGGLAAASGVAYTNWTNDIVGL